MHASGPFQYVDEAREKLRETIGYKNFVELGFGNMGEMGSSTNGPLTMNKSFMTLFTLILLHMVEDFGST